MAQTVKAFVQDSIQIVSASSPTVPLHGNDVSKGIQFMNEWLEASSANGLMITIAKHITYNLTVGQEEVTFAAADYSPTPDVTIGRLANTQNAWLLLDGVTYPLIIENRNTFLASYKYDPQLGLPRFAIIYNETDVTRMRLYPAPSQFFELNVYGKFQLPLLGENDTMSILPTYYKRFLRFAVAKDFAVYKGRMEAWTPKLEDMLTAATQDMQAVSSVNLNIETEQESYLNGAWRVRAGV